MSSPLKRNTTTIQELLNTINNLPDAGIELPELANEGTANDLFSGKQLIDDEGNVITGTFTIDNELNTQDDLIAQIQNAVDSLPDAGSGAGGGVETVQVVIDSSTWDGIVWYTDAGGQFQTKTITSYETNGITCIKGSIVVFSGYGFDPNIDYDYSLDYMDDMNENGMYLYSFSSDTIIEIANSEAGPGLEEDYQM